MEEYQRVATNVGKGLNVIKEELHRMRMATKAQVDSLALDREVRSFMKESRTCFDPAPSSKFALSHCPD